MKKYLLLIIALLFLLAAYADESIGSTERVATFIQENKLNYDNEGIHYSYTVAGIPQEGMF